MKYHRFNLSHFILTIILTYLVLLDTAFSQQQVFKIGLSAPLSGDLASVGQEIIRGLNLASKDFSNDKLSFQIISEDDQFQRKNASSAAKKLIEIDKVQAIISLWDMSEIVAPIAEQHKTPHFAIRWNPHVAEKYNYTMTIESTYRSWIDSLVKLLQYQNIKSVSLILEEAEGWILGAERLKKSLETNQIDFVSEIRYVRGDLDYRTLVQKSLRKKPEMVLLFSNPPNLEILIKKIKEFKSDQKFGGYFEILDTPAIADGMPFVAQLQPEKWFIDKYETAYKMQIKNRAPQSYDIVSLIADALKDKKEIPTGQQIVTHISNIKDFPGASGILNSKGTRTIEMNCVWKVSKNGKFELF